MRSGATGLGGAARRGHVGLHHQAARRGVRRRVADVGVAHPPQRRLDLVDQLAGPSGSTCPFMPRIHCTSSSRLA